MIRSIAEAKTVLGKGYSFKTEYTPGDVKIILGNNNNIFFADEIAFTLKVGKLALEATITAQSADKDNPKLTLEYEVMVMQPRGYWNNRQVIGRSDSFDGEHIEQTMFDMLLTFAEEKGMSFTE